jgi:hypothetical protein
MISKRLKELVAIGMIGEGITGFLKPRQYMLLWKFGPKPYQKFIEGIAEHKELTRLLCGVEAGIGVWLALRQTEK